MMDINRVLWPLLTRIQSYKLLILTGIFLSMSVWPATGQVRVPDPAQSIRDLREGYLIIRLPAFRAKIETLRSMSEDTSDPAKKARLEKWLQETLDERDTLWSDYIQAFKTQYQFSKVAYFFDYDGHDLNTATYYNLEGETIPLHMLLEKPLFYLYFERTAESRIDALVVNDRHGQPIPYPFPNNFSRGGVNILFLKISDKKFPGWRVSKINKRFFKFWSENESA